MNGWILSVIGVILLTTVFSLILPESKLGSFTKSIFSIISILIIINPIFKVFNSNIDINSVFDKTKINLQTEYLDYIQYKYEDSITKKCNEELNKIGVENAIIYVDLKINNEIEKVTINLKNAVIKDNMEHIDINEEIKAKISNLLNISTTIIEVIW